MLSKFHSLIVIPNAQDKNPKELEGIQGFSTNSVKGSSKSFDVKIDLDADYLPIPKVSLKKNSHQQENKISSKMS